MLAREAGADKVLICRYFGGLPELLRRWGASGRFWPGLDELIGGDRQAFLALPPAERCARFFEQSIDALLGADAYRQRPHLRGTTLLRVAGVMYRLLRGRRIRVFGGVELTADGGWAELKASIRRSALELLR